MAYSKSLAVDTSAFSLLLRGDEHIKELVSTSGLVAMPIVVAAELRAGFLHGKKSEKYGPILDDFLADSCTVLLQISDDTIPIYAELYAYARSKGKQLSNNDFWIAALCIQYNHPLLTGDKDFDALPQVRRIHLH
jgi:predicted nucleic acid-binding protein